MSDPKFTPFKVKRETKLYLPPQFIIMDEAEERQIAVVFDPECINLIAAAPELYAELRDLVDEISRLNDSPYCQDSTDLSSARALLSKIENP
jgi:hypothetical protein